MYPVKQFSNAIVGHCENILIMGGGPSVTTANKNIQLFYRKFKPVVLSPHYEHDIESDFVFFTGKKQIKQRIKKIKCCNVVIPKQLQYETEVNKLLQDKQIWTLGFKNSKTDETNLCPAYTGIKKIIISNGEINHDIVNCGFASILSSSFFTPRNIFLIGFDGNIIDQNGDYICSYKYDGRKMLYKDSHNQNKKWKQERLREEYYFGHILLPYICNMSNVFSDDCDKLRGVNKKNLGIQKIQDIL